jgi:hypothetical protein
MTAKFNEAMIRANQKEGTVRKLMRGLGDGRSKGGEDYALAIYIYIYTAR